MWESKIQPYWNPACSAWRASPRMRSTDRSGLRVKPNCIATSAEEGEFSTGVKCCTSQPVREPTGKKCVEFSRRRSSEVSLGFKDNRGQRESRAFTRVDQPQAEGVHLPFGHELFLRAPAIRARLHAARVGRGGPQVPRLLRRDCDRKRRPLQPAGDGADEGADRQAAARFYLLPHGANGQPGGEAGADHTGGAAKIVFHQ